VAKAELELEGRSIIDSLEPMVGLTDALISIRLV
jgi:hypothetical protein